MLAPGRCDMLPDYWRGDKLRSGICGDRTALRRRRRSTADGTGASYEALLGAAQVRRRLAPVTNMTKSQRIELRAVEAARAERTGRPTVNALFTAAADKFARAAKRLASAVWLPKRPAIRARTAATALLQAGETLAAQAVAELAAVVPQEVENEAAEALDA